MPSTLKVAALCGSLREKSYNLAALRACQSLAPEGLDIEIVTLHGVPLYNADVEARGWPEPVAALRASLDQAHAVLFAAPEYNYSVAGVLKNAIDWLSRPPGEGPIRGKPCAILGASQSMVGTARAQAHMRDITYYNAMPTLAESEVLIARAQEKFDADGRLADEQTQKFLSEFLKKFETFARRFVG